VDLLKRQPWRGNVRELRNAIYRLALLAREDVIDALALEPMLAAPRAPRRRRRCPRSGRGCDALAGRAKPRAGHDL
jgi:two-component system nitrogen regulation response regulator GlnG